jgi:hypothetical protein
MRDEDVFREVSALRRRPDTADVTASALDVHARAVARSSRSIRPSFVSDADLDHVAPPRVSTMAAIELCLAGLWRRTDDGYVVTDVDYVADVVAHGFGARRRWRHWASATMRRLWAELNRERFIPL